MLAQTGRLPPLVRSAIDKEENAAFLVPPMSDGPSPSSRLVRDLARSRDRAALATSLTDAAKEEGGWPYASLALVAVDHDLSPILLLSDLAEHSKAIATDNRVSLLFDGTQGLDQPLTGPRVTLLGRALRTTEETARRRFLARHPDAAMYAGFADFSFYRVNMARAHLVGGFGKIRWLSAAELAPPTSVPGLAQAESGIITHMNEDHADALDLYANRLLGRPGEGWKMTGIDVEGLDLRRGGEVARLGFDAPIAAVSEARQVLVALVAKARAT
jgi:putative heme iron utilization protein